MYQRIGQISPPVSYAQKDQGPVSVPWYLNQWVWLVGGGAAMVLLLLATGGDDTQRIVIAREK